LVLGLALLVCLATASCDKPQTTNGGSKDTDTIITKEPDTNFALQGTHWKLVGVFDAETDTLIKEFEPKDCEECYTLIFDTDHTATVRFISKELKLDLLNIDTNLLFNAVPIYDWFDYNEKWYDISDFYKKICKPIPRTITYDEIKLYQLYYNDVRPPNYFLIKRIEQ